MMDSNTNNNSNNVAMVENHISNLHLSSGSKSNKIVVRQLPKDVEWEDFQKLLDQYGEVVQCDHAGNVDNPTAIVTYKTSDEAHVAIEKLNNHEYKGNAMKVSLAQDRSNAHNRNNTRRAPNNNNNNRSAMNGDISGGYGGGGNGRPLSSEMPLRMVVNAKCVGAIIGQGGSNIRQITKDSKARCVVDVSRGLRDQVGNVEKVINIYGTPDNASKACIKILEIVQREMQNDQANQGKPIEPELKLRAHNNLVGRLIGKGGGTIKKIMEETGCTVFVSNIGELSPFNMERTITIKGTSLDKMSQAEQKISNKLRQCFENDITNAPHTMYGGMHPLMSFNDQYAPAAATGGYAPVGVLPHAAAAAAAAGPYGGGHLGQQGGGLQTSPSASAILQHGGGGGGGGALSAPATPAPHQMGGVGGGAGNTEVVHIWVPNNIVGALIGTKGSQIRSVMRLTGAHIRIETAPLPQQHQNGGGGGSSTEGGGDEPSANIGGGNNNNSSALNGGENLMTEEQKHASGDHRRREQNFNDSSERRVTVTGTDQQQYKAQFWIFQRICEQGYHFFDEVRLCTEIQVPSKMVGRIIGKGGQNVRELQRVTGAQVKIPEDIAHDSTDDTIVRIVGNFNAAQAVQARIRQLMQLMHNRGAGGMN